MSWPPLRRLEHKEGKYFFLASGVWDWYWMMTGMLSSRTNFMV